MSNFSTPAGAHDRHVQLDQAMLLAVLAAGAAAGFFVSRGFLLATPILALALRTASRKHAPPRFDPVDDDPTQMPPRIELAVHDTVSQLPSGEARRLLSDVVRQARPLFASLGSHFDEAKDEGIRNQAAELVLAACDTALELSRIDGLLASGARSSRLRDLELRERLAAARADFATRLSNAATALGSMYASGVEHGTVAANVVAELATELSADASARTKARSEMEDLLR